MSRRQATAPSTTFLLPLPLGEGRGEGKGGLNIEPKGPYHGRRGAADRSFGVYQRPVERARIPPLTAGDDHLATRAATAPGNQHASRSRPGADRYPEGPRR